MLASLQKSTKVLSFGRRAFSVFSGADQTVYLAGKAVREVGNTKTEIPVAREFTVVPTVGTVSIQSFVGASETIAADNTSLALLIGKDGAAKVKAIAVQDPYTSATAKLTGAGYKLSNLKLSEVFVDGAKAETDITFGDKDAPFTVLITGKDGKVAAKETGKLNVVSFSEFTAAKNAVMGQIAAAETVRLNKLLATKTQESA